MTISAAYTYGLDVSPIEMEDDTEEQLLDVATEIDGIPLPKEIKKSLWKTLGSLITGAADVPVAYLESKAAEIRSLSAAKQKVDTTTIKLVAKSIEGDQQLIDRAVSCYAGRLIKEQGYREKIAKIAVDELKVNPPKEDSAKSVDEDWLNNVFDITKNISSEELQTIWGKLIAGEIKQPGSYSIRALHTLKTLSQREAMLFERACSLATQDGHILKINNHLSESFNLTFGDFLELGAAGLTQESTSLNVTYNGPFLIGEYAFVWSKENTKDIQFSCWKMSPIGIEIKKLVKHTTREDYVNTIAEYIHKMGYKIHVLKDGRPVLTNENFG